MAIRNSPSGEDSLGFFDTENYKRCGVCHESPIGTVIVYRHAPKLSDYVKHSRSLLLRVDAGTKVRLARRVGVNCGCYAKVHRQVKAIELGGDKHGKA